jgi:dopamine beta-monooxygenase
MTLSVVIRLSVFFASTYQRVDGFSSYRNNIPNGFNVQRAGESFPGVGHTSKAGGGALNDFGTAFASAGRTWTIALCQADSDGDGQSNGFELGDPDCVWTPGATPARSTDISHPGFADSTTLAVAPQAEAPTQTIAPTIAPTKATSAPTASPSASPGETDAPSLAVTFTPSSTPTTFSPTSAPTDIPTSAPTGAPSFDPTALSLDELENMTAEGDSSQCYVALFAGPDCRSDGGVYLISSDWYANHLGGNFGTKGFCGKVYYNWLQANPSHAKWADALASDLNLTQPATDPSGLLRATYVSEFRCAVPSIQEPALGDDTQSDSAWTLLKLEDTTVEGDPSQCYVALFAGAECGTDGGVYLISADWYVNHFGGNFGTKGFCGKVHYNWLQSNPSHAKWADALASDLNLTQPATDPSGKLRATYVDELACGLVNVSNISSNISNDSDDNSTITLPASSSKIGWVGIIISLACFALSLCWCCFVLLHGPKGISCSREMLQKPII